MRSGYVRCEFPGDMRGNDCTGYACGSNAPAWDACDPGVRIDEMRDELNERHPSFFCDALIDETTSPLDRDAMRAAGLFEARLFFVESAKLASSKQEPIEYLQREFAARGLALPAGIDRALEGACARAEDMALELLEGRERL